MISQILVIVAAVVAFAVYVWSAAARRRGVWFSWWVGIPILLLSLSVFALRLAGVL
ncbi:MAG: hypothetical protein Q4A92_01520 [Corynebacterium sp.]|nr:hypothetical protein [Corynebacterium sp.]